MRSNHKIVEHQFALVDACCHDIRRRGRAANVRERFAKTMRRDDAMRIATVWACVALSSVPASAGDHIYLSCMPHSMATTTKFADGRVETEKELPLKVSFEIDVDLEHRFINGVNLPLEHSSALSFRGLETFVSGSKYRSSWSTSMTIDMLTGWAWLSATWAM